MNTPVSYELAKLLKEKDINIFTTLGNVTSLYNKNGVYTPYVNYGMMYSGLSDGFISAPTIADVVMWVYEKYGVWMWVEKGKNPENFYLVTQNFDFKYFPDLWRDTIPEAYEAGITYILNNLL